jgi:hypothetical protein
MSTLADLFLCPTSELTTLDCEDSPLKKLGGSYDGVEFKDVTSLDLKILWALLEDADWAPDTHPSTMIHRGVDEEDTAAIEHFPARMIGVFANADDARIASVARNAAGTTNFKRFEADQLMWMMKEVRELARRADGRELCLWSAL